LKQVFEQLHKKYGVTLETITKHLLVAAPGLQSQTHQLLIKELDQLLKKNTDPLEEKTPTKEKKASRIESVKSTSVIAEQKKQLHLFAEQSIATANEPVEIKIHPTITNNKISGGKENYSLVSWLIKLQQELSYTADSDIAL